MIYKGFKSINHKIICLTLEEIGERYERMKLELFKERNKNREIIEDLQEVRKYGLIENSTKIEFRKLKTCNDNTNSDRF